MKERKRTIPMFQMFDYQGIEAYLNAQAKKGWLLEKMGVYTWTFRRGEAGSMRYTVVFQPKASMYDPKRAGNEAFEELCNAAGWEKVDERGKMQIYGSQEPEPTPIDTDEAIKLQNVKNSVITGYVLPVIILIILINLNGSGFISVLLDPGRFLTSYVHMISGLMNLTVSMMLIVSLIAIGRWAKKSQKSIEAGGTCVELSGFRRVYKGVSASAFVMLVFWICGVIAEDAGPIAASSILALIAILLIMVIVDRITEALRDMNVSKVTNMVITGAVTLLLVGGTVFGLALIGVQATSDDDRTISPEQVTITPADLRETKADEYAYYLDRHSTFLMGSESCDIMSEDAPYDMEYEILYAKDGVLRDQCLKSWIREGNGFRDLFGVAESTETRFQTVPTDILTADNAYRYYDAGEPDNLWILCYPDKIVKVQAYFETDANDLAIMDRMLAAK